MARPCRSAGAGLWFGLMSVEENKKIALAYFAERSAGDPRAFDRLADSATWMIMAKGPMGGTA